MRCTDCILRACLSASCRRRITVTRSISAACCRMRSISASSASFSFARSTLSFSFWRTITIASSLSRFRTAAAFRRSSSSSSFAFRAISSPSAFSSSSCCTKRSLNPSSCSCCMVATCRAFSSRSRASRSSRAFILAISRFCTSCQCASRSFSICFSLTVAVTCRRRSSRISENIICERSCFMRSVCSYRILLARWINCRLSSRRRSSSILSTSRRFASSASSRFLRASSFCFLWAASVFGQRDTRA
mmetsp:Transcript_17081/g.54851  ORF Transcript_17081/g.54851 Transcript_17081/m.54851 type:complete len:247 (-) Transcript_17081:156-896(-)